MGSAVVRNGGVENEILRVRMAAMWDGVMGKIESGDDEGAMVDLRQMFEGLDAWANRGRECDEEFWEMRKDVIEEMDKVMGRMLEKKAGSIRKPTRAIRKGELMRITLKAPAGEHLTELPITPPLSTVKPSQHLRGTTSSHSDEGNRLPSIHRRESEQLVEDAMSRGKPLTLFHDPFNSSPIEFTPRYTRTTLPPRHPDSDKISLRSVLTMETPGVRSRRRDITPTPSDPHGLRADSQYFTPQIMSIPRKRAGIYATPRWPKGGRPSPPVATPTPTESLVRSFRTPERATNHPTAPLFLPPTPVERREADPGAERRKSTSIYEELLREGDETADPAELIWEGINEEYSSPNVGRFTRWRRLRRNVSRHTLAND